MAGDDAPVAHTNGPRAQHEFALLDRQHLRAHQSRGVGPIQQANDQDDSLDPSPPDRDNDQHQGQGGDHHQEIGQSHQDVVDPTPVKACGQANGRADKDGHERGRKADQKRDPRAIDKQAQHVFASVVPPQQMFRIGRSQNIRGCHVDALVRIVGCQPGSKDGDKDYQQEHEQTNHGSGPAAERSPNLSDSHSGNPSTLVSRGDPGPSTACRPQSWR